MASKWLNEARDLQGLCFLHEDTMRRAEATVGRIPLGDSGPIRFTFPCAAVPAARSRSRRTLAGFGSDPAKDGASKADPGH